MVDEDVIEPGIPLGAALAGLPLESPERSAWPMLAARLSPPTRRVPRWPFAIAAGLLALALLPRGLPPATQQPESTTSVAVSQNVELAALMSESARLERLINAANDDGASSATATALSLELEARLHALDGELEANRDQGRQLALWQQRVQLLREVAAVETSRHYLAAEGRNLDVALVAAY
jgi:hypothetical protein